MGRGMEWEKAARRDRVAERGGEPVWEDLPERQVKARHKHKWTEWRTPSMGNKQYRECRSCRKVQYKDRPAQELSGGTRGAVARRSRLDFNAPVGVPAKTAAPQPRRSRSAPTD